MEQKPFNTTHEKPNFAIRAIVIKDGKVLLGKSVAEKYAFPGGHLQYLESFQTCIARELMEECGIEVENVRYSSVSNVVEEGNIHNVHITLLADWKSGEAKVMEPGKYTSWDWYDLNNLPQPLFKNCELSLQSYKTGKNYFDIGDITQ